MLLLLFFFLILVILLLFVFFIMGSSQCSKWELVWRLFKGVGWLLLVSQLWLVELSIISANHDYVLFPCAVGYTSVEIMKPCNVVALDHGFNCTVIKKTGVILPSLLSASYFLAIVSLCLHSVYAILFSSLCSSYVEYNLTKRGNASRKIL